MPNIFVAMENPASWLGDKRDNLPRSDRYDRRDLSRAEDKYRERTARLSLARVRSDRAIMKERPEVEAVFDKPRPFGEGTNAKLAASGSLPSMMTRLAHFADDEGRVDTIVFVGHGAPGVMGVGAGVYSFTPEHEDVFRGSHRDIGLTNQDAWRPAFEAIKDKVAPGIEERVHVFLLGCCTAVPGAFFGYEKRLTDVLAEMLAKIFGLPVSVYGTTEELEVSQTAKVLKKLLWIEQQMEAEIPVEGTNVVLRRGYGEP
jgi:hypothetical protein